jgi:hypothetical protein
MTYRLLFPFQDERWLAGQIGEAGGPRDSALSSPAVMDIPSGLQDYKLPLRSVGDLQRRYPHWAARLQMIFEEADDPTPTTPELRWFERHALGITAWAFGVTILFGILTLVVGCIQILFAMCALRPSISNICRSDHTQGDGSTVN